MTPAPGPLDKVGSIKLKLGLLVAAMVVLAMLLALIGDRAEVPIWLTIPVTLTGALLATLWLARGMTSPLREMTDVAGSMASGDLSRRVAATSADEVGTLARAFNAMAADLATADEQRRQLVATVSHELRTPLAAQRALLENLADGVVTPDSQTLSTALAQSERLSALVEDLLDLSRVESGARSLDLRPTSVRELLDAAVAEAHLSERDVRYAVRVTPEELTVDVDPARFTQVVANLLDNAGRHSPVGGAVRLTAYRNDDDTWSLDVADDGPGIPADVRSKVFERFGTGSDAGGGTGIGLAIARWVCDLHGGAITALDPPGGHGALVRTTLPTRPRPTPTTPVEEPVNISQQSLVVPPPDATRVLGKDDLWPERDSSPKPGLFLGSLGVGLLGALLLPEHRIGIGALVVLLAAGGLIWSASASRWERWTLVSAGLCLALSVLVVLRATEWLAVLAVFTSGVLVASALTAATTVAGMVSSCASWVFSGLRGLPLLGRTLGALSSRGSLWPVLRTAALSLVALVLFGGLFASADAVFGSWAANLIPDLAWDNLILRSFVLVLVGGVALAGTYLAVNPPNVDAVRLPPGTPTTRRWEWFVPLGLVVALFMAFLAAQAAAYFGGDGYVQRTTGLTYAAYVHQGFRQLLVVTLLVLAVVGIALRKAPLAGSAERKAAQGLLAALLLLTLVVVGSALYRLALYQQAYGFTELRLLLDVFEGWLGVVVGFLLVGVLTLRTRWVPRAALLTGACAVLVLGLANPNARIAEWNIARGGTNLDGWYLRSLGPDATPAIVDSALPNDLKACIVNSMGSWTEMARVHPRGPAEWNLGWQRGLAAAERAGQPASSCTALLGQHTVSD